MMMLIRCGGGGILTSDDALRIAPGFFFDTDLPVVFPAAFFPAEARFDAGFVEPLAFGVGPLDFRVAATGGAVRGAAGAGVEGFGTPSGGTPIGAVPAGAAPSGATPAGGTAIGATVPVETDVVVLLACCVPFVAPNSPATNGFAMQS